ncbi:hypothetical protein JS528_09525 [Bifidobacterium sp. MA2]|uniref:Uncharacterized protein n=1 Tax=Bifidobacterium santillanense TaxID=2809028 RepID=A0ABS5URH0_9BIFI|nr:hypothetical protein [Bifidobacterium santillanense]MBT1173574.1 hypothetical protein [Bifidobacterium santillanense]
MTVSYRQARDIMAGIYAGECTTSPEGYENANYWKVPTDAPPDLEQADDCTRLISKETGEITPFHTFPFDEEGQSNLSWINAMTPVYDDTADPEYLDLLKRYQAEYGEGYFDDNPVHGLTETQIKANITTALAD